MNRLVHPLASIATIAAILTTQYAAAQNDPEYSRFNFDSDSQTPAANASPYADDGVQYGAFMPYTRYEAEEGEDTLGGGATQRHSDIKNIPWQEMQRNIASQASNRRYAELPVSGSFVEWTATRSGNAITLRFNIQDSNRKPLRGLYGNLDLYINDKKVKTIGISSKWAYQYFTTPNGVPSGVYGKDNNDRAGTHDAYDSYPGGGCFPAFAFDEAGILLDTPINQGDKIKIQNSGNTDHIYGVDFIEVEKVKEKVCPAGFATFTGGDLQSFINSHDKIYIPKGYYENWGKLYTAGKIITGAGIFYTEIHFSDGGAGGSAFVGQGGELSDIHLTTELTSRIGQQADAKGLEGSNIFAHYSLNIFSEILFYRLSLYISYLQMFSFGLNTHEISRF